MKKESLIQALSLMFLISVGTPSCENSCNNNAPDPTGKWHCKEKKTTLTIKKDGYNTYSFNQQYAGGSSFFAGNYDDGAIKGSGGCSVGFLVNDPSIKFDSRIFATLRENADCHWVGNVSDGMFSINLERTADKNIPFDYFVDNASLAKVKEGNLNIHVEKVEDKIRIPSNKENSQKVELQEYSDQTPPSSPPDLGSAWTWSKKSGFVKTGDGPK